jgi:hypothetical protein
MTQKGTSFTGRDEWELSEFTMFENMIQTEEKLKSVRHKLQRIVSTVQDRIPVKGLLSQRERMLEADARPQAKDLKSLDEQRPSSPRKSGRPFNTPQTALQSVAKHKRRSRTTARPVHTLHSREGGSKLPVKDERIPLRKFVLLPPIKEVKYPPI